MPAAGSDVRMARPYGTVLEKEWSLQARPLPPLFSLIAALPPRMDPEMPPPAQRPLRVLDPGREVDVARAAPTMEGFL